MEKPNSKSLSLVSLFAGAGGLDIGLERAGFRTCLATDIEAFTCESLRANQLLHSLSKTEFDSWFAKQLEQRCYRRASPEDLQLLRRRIEFGRRDAQYLSGAQILQADIRAVPSKKLMELAGVTRGALSLVAGGVPCQPFSRAGKRQAVEVEEGRLFLEFVRVVRDLRPRWFLFENVKGLILTATVVVFALCKKCGKKAVVPFEKRARYLGGGCPQAKCACGAENVQLFEETRKTGSLEIIEAELQGLGYTTHKVVLEAADFGAPQYRERLIIVGSRDHEKFTWPHPRFRAKPLGSGQGMLFKSTDQCEPHNTMLKALWPQGHPRFGKLDNRKAVLWVKNVVRPHDEPVTWTLDQPSPTIGAHQAAKLALAPNGVPEAQLIRQQWHLKGHRQGDLPPVYVEHEYLSDAELLTLQTFPTNWYLFGTRMQRASQIGNAVPVVLGEALGKALLGASETHTHKAQAGRNGAEPYESIDSACIQQR